MSTSTLTEQAFAEIIAKNGGQAFRVGGCVRDSFRGVTPQDIDFTVVGMVKKNFKMLFPEAEECGKSFPLFCLAINGIKREVAFARREWKVGSGYKGFRVSAKPKITIQEDLFRRDTTVNSIAQDCLTGEIIDPYHGREDIEARILRATSEHFSDDPLRALRLAGQAACFGFTIASATLPLVTAAAAELAQEPVERITVELGKVLSVAPQPGMFFKVLAETHILPVTFKELAALSSSDFARVMAALDTVARGTQKPKVRFAAFGLGLDQVSLNLWNDRMKLPGDWLDAAVTVCDTIDCLAEITPEKIVDTINKLRRGSITLEEFDLMIQAGGLKIPLLVPLKAVMVLPQGERVPKTLQGKEIGEWLRKKYVEILSQQLLSD